MPVFIAAMLGGLINITGALVGRVLVALGLSAVSYTGMNATLDWMKSQAVAKFALLPGDAVAMLSTLKVGECISIVTSAILARAVINGVQSDTVKKWVLK